MANQKNFIKGSAREVEFSNGGSVLNISLNMQQLQELEQTKGYVNLTISARREADQYGNTHMIYENTFKPKEGAQAATPKAKPAAKKAAPDGDTEDDLPF